MPLSEGRQESLRLLRPPRLRTLEDEQRHASYLELFFDLVFVVAIAQLSHELVLDHSLHGFAVFGGGLEPVAFTGFATGIVVGLVVLKLWTAHRAGVAEEVDDPLPLASSGG